MSKFGEILPSGSGKASYYRFGEILVGFCILQRAVTLHWLGVAPPHVLLLAVGPSWASACILIILFLDLSPRGESKLAKILLWVIYL